MPSEAPHESANSTEANALIARPSPTKTTNRSAERRKLLAVAAGVFGMSVLASGVWDSSRFSGPPPDPTGVNLGEPPAELAFADNENPDEEPTNNDPSGRPNLVETEDQAAQDRFDSSDWEIKLAEIARTNNSPIDKLGEVTQLADNYQMDEATAVVHADYLAEEFISGAYIDLDHEDEQYILRNTFLALVIDKSFRNLHPINRFASAFAENSMNVYQGVDQPTNDSVLANEELMRKALTDF